MLLRHHPRSLVLLLLFLLCCAGCTEDPLFPEQSLTVVARDLPSLGADSYYELWMSYPEGRARVKEDAIDHDEHQYFSVGRFRVDASGTAISLGGGAATFAIPSGYDPSLIADAILTLEQTGKSDTLPGPRLLAGRFVGSEHTGYDTLTLAGSDAFGPSINATDTAAPIGRFGSFVLDVPTTPVESDFASGVWFIRPGFDSASGELNGKSLGLPGLPPNENNTKWTYESWLLRTVTNPQTGAETIEHTSLGRFVNPAFADDNAGGPGAGPDLERAYRKPGEDFVSPGKERILNDGTYHVVVSLQPIDRTFDRPLIVLLKSSPIPAGTARLQSIRLTTPATEPRVEVILGR